MKFKDIQTDVCVVTAPGGHRVPLLIVRPRRTTEHAPGVLRSHGGGYALGMKEMVFGSRALDMVRNHGAVVVSPGFRLAWQAPYPAAFDDCYRALLFLRDHARELGVNSSQIFVGWDRSCVRRRATFGARRVPSAAARFGASDA